MPLTGGLKQAESWITFLKEESRGKEDAWPSLAAKVGLGGIARGRQIFKSTVFASSFGEPILFKDFGRYCIR
jgi:hypothetical protein